MTPAPHTDRRGGRAAAPLTCDSDLIDGPVGLAGSVSGDVVAESDRGERDEAVVERVQEGPALLDPAEDGRRDQEEEAGDEHADGGQVEQPDVERLVQVAQTRVQPLPSREINTTSINIGQ